MAFGVLPMSHDACCPQVSKAAQVRGVEASCRILRVGEQDVLSRGDISTPAPRQATTAQDPPEY